MSDRSAPVFTIRVIPPGGQAASLDDSIRVVSLKYEDNEKLADKLTLVVDNFDLSLFDNPVFSQGTVLEVAWGYPGNMSTPRQCVIVKTKGFQTLTIEAHGKEILFGQIVRTRTFQNMSRADVARQIATENGFDASVQDIDDTGAPLSQVTQARMTDHELLRSMAHREGFELWVDASGFHFHARRLGQAPRRKFVFYTDSGEGDIIGIDIENDLTARPGAVVTKGLDPQTKQPFSFVADNHGTSGRPSLSPMIARPEVAKADQAVSATGVITKVAAGGLGGLASLAAATVIASTELAADAAKRAASGAYARSSMSGVQLSMTCVGDPQMTAKSVFELAGVGTKIGGNYYAQTVTHALGGGYTMSIKARRDGTSAAANDAQAQALKSAGAVNKTKGPDEPSTDLVPVQTYDAKGAPTGVQYKPAGAAKG